MRIVSLILLLLGLAAVPAAAQFTFYSNGPINGTTDAWTINSGFVVSDTFTASGFLPATSGLSFGAWLLPGDILQSAQVSITSAEFGGTAFYDQVVSFTQSGCSGNQYGFDVCTESTGFFGLGFVNLVGGTYWLNLANAVVNDGDPIYWDENSGPSSASENSVGTIPSESFTISYCECTTTITTSSTGTVPEPSSTWLLGSGILALAGVLRRRLF
jgi:hypothetical protein